MINIAIIEDQPELRQGLAEMFEYNAEFTLCGVYDSGFAALEEITETASPDVILLDMQMPGMNGVETLQELRKRSITSKIIIYTVFETNQLVFDALRAGASGYILKKESPERIIECIHEALNEGAPMSREIANKVIAYFRSDAAPGGQGMDNLTTLEQDFLRLLSEGFMYKEIADKHNISLQMVKYHLHKIYQKMQVTNRTQAIKQFQQHS
ncbi:MAG: response regulator transcription factor [Saprospiraceae bacterium]|nr:response regulator transcription factor [Saprospiraceae bacterium]